ncbi:hypothetical protein MIR68_007765 [Amoeboaphelidium protococcarum]|nr:hypothetical protein MIR68_007765 [Amoeboaphelidium protococcarum]
MTIMISRSYLQYSLNCSFIRVSRFQSYAKETGPLLKYKELVAGGVLRRDDNQLQCVEQLQNAFLKYQRYIHSPQTMRQDSKSSSWFSRVLGGLQSTSSTSSGQDVDTVPQGLYIYGSVGSGKTMLMNMLHQSLIESEGGHDHADVQSQHQQVIKRVHYHAFMQSVHQDRHHRRRKFQNNKNDALISRLHDKGLKLLFLDEFQVTDIADAMILHDLLKTYRRHGTVIVYTSNRHPDDLYKNGIQRQSFLPCIEMIKNVNQIINLDGDLDYRSIQDQNIDSSDNNGNTLASAGQKGNSIDGAAISTWNGSVWFKKRQDFLNLLQLVIQKNGDAQLTPSELSVWSRPVSVPAQSQQLRLAHFSFNELCLSNWSSSEYIEITSKYKIIFVRDIPYLDLSYLMNPHGTRQKSGGNSTAINDVISRDQIRRFITFVDCAYEAQCVLVGHSDRVEDVKVLFNTQMFGDDFKDSTAQEEIFAFRRAMSRLVQMQSYSWTRPLQALIKPKQ